jgi:hypothetical protein
MPSRRRSDRTRCTTPVDWCRICCSGPSPAHWAPGCRAWAAWPASGMRQRSWPVHSWSAGASARLRRSVAFVWASQPPVYRWRGSVVLGVCCSNCAISRYPCVRHSPGLGTTLLPCGWLYVFVASAGGTGSVRDGMLLMAVFWLGTVPAMLAVGLGAQRVFGPFRRKLPTLGAVTVLVMGLLAVSGRLTMSSSHAAHLAGVTLPGAAASATSADSMSGMSAHVHPAPPQ